MPSRDFTLRDWEAANTSRDTYSSMRLGILGACLTILGLVVTLSKDASYPGIIGSWCVLLVVSISGVRMLASVTRAVHVFGAYMVVLEEELGEVGFATCWGKNIRQDASDSASRAFIVATRLLSACVSFLVGVSALGVAGLQERFADRVLIGAFGAMALVCLFWNEWYVRREFNPESFYWRIEALMRRSRASAIESRSDFPKSRTHLDEEERGGLEDVAEGHPAAR